MRAASNIDVPLLIEHSERDYRYPMDHAHELIAPPLRLGKTRVESVRFSGEGHELLRAGRPRNRVLRRRAIAHWFTRYL